MPLKNCFLLPPYQSLCDVTISWAGLRTLWWQDWPCYSRKWIIQNANKDSRTEQGIYHNRVNLKLWPSYRSVTWHLCKAHKLLRMFLDYNWCLIRSSGVSSSAVLALPWHFLCCCFSNKIYSSFPSSNCRAARSNHICSWGKEDLGHWTGKPGVQACRSNWRSMYCTMEGETMLAWSRYFLELILLKTLSCEVNWILSNLRSCQWWIT